MKLNQLLETFISSSLLEAALVILPDASGNHLEIKRSQGSVDLLHQNHSRILALAAHLKGATALVDAEGVAVLIPLEPGGVLCGLRRRGQFAFTEADLEKAEKCAQKVKLELEKPAEKAAEVPNLIGERYQRSSKILQGPFSTLYSALDRQTQQAVLLRRLEGGDLSHEMRQQLLSEGRRWSALQHQNLPTVLDTVDHYQILEAFSGRSLAKMRSKGKNLLSSEVLVNYLGQFLDVLGYLHGQSPPIIHRDLRPENILCTAEGLIKILELGFSVLRDNAVDPRQNAEGALGHPVFAAPSQLQGYPPHPTHDLYAVGSILYFLASGEVPAPSLQRWEGSATSGEVPLAQLRPDLPPDICSLIEQLRSPQDSLRCKGVSDEPAVVETSPQVSESNGWGEVSENERIRHLLCFTMMLSILVKGGLSFGRIFAFLATLEGHLPRQVLSALEKSVLTDGEPLSKAMAAHPEVFSDQYVALVEMGESTRLSRCLDRLCYQLELDYLKDQPREEYRPALTMALQNLVDALEASGSESKALAWAVRTCSDDKVRQAFQFLERQVQAGTRLAECQYPNVFMPITANLVAAHDAVGTLTLAYKELARLLSR